MGGAEGEAARFHAGIVNETPKRHGRGALVVRHRV